MPTCAMIVRFLRPRDACSVRCPRAYRPWWSEIAGSACPLSVWLLALSRHSMYGSRELVDVRQLRRPTDRLVRNPPPVNTYALISHLSAHRGDGPATRSAPRPRRSRANTAPPHCSIGGGGVRILTGLYYPPNMMAPIDEVIAVAEALTGAGGLYVTHMRDEANDVLVSIEETLRIGRAVSCPW